MAGEFACVRACVRAVCVHACVRACVGVCVCVPAVSPQTLICLGINPRDAGPIPDRHWMRFLGGNCCLAMDNLCIFEQFGKPLRSPCLSDLLIGFEASPMHA